MKHFKKHLTTIVLGFLLINNASCTKVEDDLEILRKRFIADQMAPEVKEDLVRSLISSINSDGNWSNINYTDVSRTGFQHGRHLKNLVELARAYKKDGSILKGDSKLKTVINLALDYWLAKDFICDNWWWNQIGTPTELGSFLLIMDKDITPVQEEKTLAIVGRANLDASGARPSGDRIKIAGIYAKRALYTRNKEEFNKTVRVIEGEIKFSSERGMQYDYSFHHRTDRVNNTLSYGVGYADAFAEWAANVAGTSYKFSDKASQQLIDYYLDGICKQMVYGKFTDPGVMNRDITRRGEFHAAGTLTPERLVKVTDYRKAELLEIIKVRKGEIKPSMSFSKFFWNSEHFVIQRPNYFTSVRMFSTRNRNMEEAYNSEGLMNHHRGDGTNYISRTGLEYSEIAPIYDWQKIPGATILQRPSLPPETEIQKAGSADFVGAVTDGMYGAVAFDFISPHNPLKAKKAWFFFDNEYVCLGAGITAGIDNSVVTTLNQCRLNGGVTVMAGTGTQKLEKGEHALEKVNWVYHDGIGYFFPEPVNINLSNKVEAGNWYSISRSSSNLSRDEVRSDIFKLWLDHGKKPQNDTYKYIILPATSEKKLTEISNNNPIEIIANTINEQAVKHNGLNITEAVFYNPGDIQVSNKVKINIASAGVILVKTDGENIKNISVADPSRKLKMIQLSVNQKINASGESFIARWDDSKKVSIITIDLPQEGYAGKSVTINL